MHVMAALIPERRDADRKNGGSAERGPSESGSRGNDGYHYCFITLTIIHAHER